MFRIDIRIVGKQGMKYTARFEVNLYDISEPYEMSAESLTSILDRYDDKFCRAGRHKNQK